MKNRKWLVLLLTVVLMFSLSAPALAVKAQYPTTASFLEYLDSKDMKYKYLGVDQDDDEEVTVSFEGDYMDTIKVEVFFDEDLDVVSMRVWDVIAFKEEDFFDVLKTVNELNDQYKFINFTVDTDDWTVTASLDAPLRDCEEAGEISFDGLYYIMMIADEGYDVLAKFAS